MSALEVTRFQFGPMFNSTEADIDRLLNAVGDALYQVK